MFGMGKLSVKFFAVTLIFILSIVGCSSGGSGSSGTTEPGENKVVISGVAQKGNFSNLRVIGKPFDPVSGSFGEPVEAQVEGNSFSLEVDPDVALVLEASGDFSDETTGKTLTINRPLKSFVGGQGANADANINLFSSMAAERLLNRVEASGQPMSRELLEQSALEEQSFVTAALGLAANTELNQLRIDRIPDNADIDNANLQLLLTSAALLAENTAANTAGSLLENVIEQVAAAQNTEQAQNGLGVIGGINAADLYADIQAAGAVANLPDLSWQAPPIWQCRDGNCDWLIVTDPEINVAGDAVHEVDGEASITLRLNRRSSSPVAVRVYTSDVTAEADRDYRGFDQLVQIPANTLSHKLRLPLIVDQSRGDQLEPLESIAVSIESQTTGYDVGQNTAYITINDEIPEGLAPAANSQLALQQLCARGIGLASEHSASSCSDLGADLLALKLGDTPTLALELGLEQNCSGAACGVRRDWLVEFYLVALDTANAVQGEAALGQYRYPSSALADDADAREFYLALNQISAAELMLAAKAANQRLAVQARLQTQPEQLLISSPLPQLLPLPEQLIGGDWPASISGEVALAEASATGCDNGQYAMQTQVHMDAGAERDAVVCVDINFNSATQSVEAELIEGNIDLNNAVINLPAGHRMLVSSGIDALPLPMGLSQLSVRDAFDGSGNPDSGRVWLHAEGLPFAYRVANAFLTPQGLRVDYDRRYMLTRPDFSSQDPRAQASAALGDVHAYKSNDAMYAPLEGNATASLLLTQSGIREQLRVGAEKGMLAVPAAQIDWQGFDAQIEAGRLQGVDKLAAALRLRQSSDCRQPACAQGAYIDYRVDAEAVQLDGFGAALGVAALQNNQIPGWGSFGAAEAQLAFSRPDDFAQTGKAVLALPGFVFVAHERGMSDYLLGHLQSNSDPAANLINHPLGSSAANLGNYFPVGIGLGPKLYVDSSAEVQVATGVGVDGQDLAGLALLINNGADTISLDSSSASKYVLRNSGVTGVFNIDSAALSAPVPVYGYGFELDRFAIRLSDNRVDPFNYVDGHLALAGDAGFEIHFENLGIDCGARFGQGVLLHEANCTGEDDNGNGYIDENCSARLSSWKADSDVFAMAFKNADGSEAQSCDASDQLLQLQHQVEMKSLNKPVQLQALWRPDGTLEHSQAALLDSYLLEQSEDSEGNALAGFGIQVAGAHFQRAELTGADQPYGWMQMDGATLAVPFWQALNSDVRIANRQQGIGPDAPITADFAVVAQANTLAGLTPEQQGQSNKDLLAALTGDSNYDITASYEWGNTGFGFGLPVYYSSALANSDSKARFIGRRQEADLFVLEAGAGINYIEADRTKLSFGASADIAKLKELEFQIDLDDPDNLKVVDDVLVKLNVLDEPVLEPALGAVQEKLDTVNDFANKGLDDLMRKALVESLKAAGEAAAPATPNNQDPFVTVSEALAWIKSLPDQVSGLLQDEIRRPVDRLLNEHEAALQSELQNLEAELLALGMNAAVPPQVIARIATIENLLQTIKSQAQAVNAQVSRPVAEAKSLLSDIDKHVGDVDRALSDIDNVLQEVVGFVESTCANPANSGDQAHGYLNQILGQLGTVRDLLQLVEGTDVLTPIAELAVNDPDVRERLLATQQDVQRKAEELAGFLNDADQAVRDQICAEDVNNVLAEVNSAFSEIRAHVAQVQGISDQIQLHISRAEEVKTLVQSKVFKPINQLQTALADIKRRLNQWNTQNIAGTTLVGQVDNLLSEVSQGEITALYSASGTGEVDPADYVFGLAKGEIDSLFDQVDELLVGELEDLLPGAFFTSEQLRAMIANQIMATGPVQDLRNLANEQLAEINRKINELLLSLTDQVNQTIQGAVASLENEINEALEEATAVVREIPLDSAALDGYAVIAGNELERAHIGAQWTMSPSADGEPGNTFGAALDAVSWSANNKAAGCSIPEGESRLDVSISALNIPAKIGESDIVFKSILLGFTLASGTEVYALTPVGVFGGITSSGEIGFTEFVIYDPALAAGIGVSETYIGARAGALFSDIQAEVAFLAGKTCNQEVLMDLDPEVAKFIELPPGGFAGAYVRGAASFPIYSAGCPLTVGVGADFGAWLFVGEPTVFGGLVGGAAYGKVLCVGALRGQIRAIAQFSSDGDASFIGSGFGVAGLGFCEPAGWTSVERSRKDKWCGTGDAQFSAGYQNGWIIGEIGASAIH